MERVTRAKLHASAPKERVTRSWKGRCAIGTGSPAQNCTRPGICVQITIIDYSRGVICGDSLVVDCTYPLQDSGPRPRHKGCRCGRRVVAAVRRVVGWPDRLRMRSSRSAARRRVRPVGKERGSPSRCSGRVTCERVSLASEGRVLDGETPAKARGDCRHPRRTPSAALGFGVSESEMLRTLSQSLMVHAPSSPRSHYDSLLAGRCAPGRRVGELSNEESLRAASNVEHSIVNRCG